MNLRGRKYINTDEGQQWLADQIRDMERPEHGFVCEITLGKRTQPQNNALHLYCSQLAKALDDAGLDIHMEFLGKSINIPWTGDLVKERIWKPAQEAMTGKKSTTKLDINEVSEVFEVLYRHFAENHGIMVVFPSKEAA